jgi:hypothetical protein
VPSLMDRISKFAKSKQGRELTDDAKRFASDPKNRAKLDDVRKKLMSRGKKQPPPH